jgi:hypothetical protein
MKSNCNYFYNLSCWTRPNTGVEHSFANVRRSQTEDLKELAGDLNDRLEEKSSLYSARQRENCQKAALIYEIWLGWSL